jgi:N-acetylglucosaminyldiphosphoundecaprenol N-acetyl-beta-D-mannosaminyltransferase
MLLKRRLFAVDYTVTNYEQASSLIIEHAKNKNSFGVTALATHGLVEAVWDESFAYQVNLIDLIVPDGQPIRFALNSFHKTGLTSPVTGPELTLHVLKKANEFGLKVFLYGSTSVTLEKIVNFISQKYPNVIVCGVHSDRFREATEEEDRQDIEKINSSGAHLVLVGRGCPRQERWVATHQGKIHASMMAVGAAFDFMAGNIKRAPLWMQKNGLEWLYRLAQDPKRLWKRYLTTNSYFIFLFLKHKFAFLKSTARK